jgi:hypothetical protein
MSLALHGGVVAVLLVIAGGRATPPVIELTPIEVFDPPLARTFEFYPALDRDGEPTSGTFQWVFVISIAYTNEDDGKPEKSETPEARRLLF